MISSLKAFIIKLITPIIVASLTSQGLIVTPKVAPIENPVRDSQPTLGAFNPTGGSSYRLQSSIGLSDTSINLSSFKEPVSGVPYTMSYLNSSVAYATLDPQTLTKSEFISFTGITQNSDGTARLTGVSRGLSRTPGTGGCVASTTLAQSHSGQSFLILSNSPCFYSEFAVLKNNETITGDWTVPSPANATSIANRNYIDGKVFSGIGGASETATGTVEIATQTENASSTTNGSLGRLVTPASLATSTYNYNSAPLRTVVTDNNGFIDNFFTRSAATSTANENINALDAVVFGDMKDNLVASTSLLSTQFFSVADTAPLSITSNLTLEGWFKPLTVVNGSMDLISKFNAAPNISYSLELRSGCSPTPVPQCLQFRYSSDGTTQSFVYLPITLPINTWTHIAVVLNATSTATTTAITVPQTFSYYINGDLASSTAVTVTSIADTAAQFEIGGAQADGTGSTFNGQVSDIRVWNVPRTSEQIKNSYRRRLSGTEQGLAGYWKLDGNLLDSTSNAANLTNNGGATFKQDTPSGIKIFGDIMSPLNISTTTVFRSNASDVTRYQRFIGFADRTAALGSQVKILTNGFVQGFTNLVSGATYYLGDTAGSISTTPGTFTKQVGLALSTTTLLISR